MVSEWSGPEDALDDAFHADFFHWFSGYNDLIQKESWRILNGYSEGHSFFDQEGKGNIVNFLDSYMAPYEATREKGYICIPLGNHDNARINVKRSYRIWNSSWHLALPFLEFHSSGTETKLVCANNMACLMSRVLTNLGQETERQCSGVRAKTLGFLMEIRKISTSLSILPKMHRR